jgi:hypothetical protein
MADTVVTIGGDSTGLQGAFKDAGKSAGTVKVEAKKLSDQLREVADDADKAAGALAQKLGGPGAIKAIAGIGSAVGIAKAGVEAFLDSSEALFKSYGDEGQKVWDDTEKSLFAIKGAFAEAVLGGGSMEEMGARLKGMFDAVKRLLDGMLLPIKLVTAAFYDNADGSEAARKGLKDYEDALERSKKSSKDLAEQTNSLTQEIWALTGQTDKLNTANDEATRSRIMNAIAGINAEELAQDQRIALTVQEANMVKDRDRALTDAMRQHHRLDREGMELADKLTAQYQQESYDKALAAQTHTWNAERKAALAVQTQNLADLAAYIKKREEEAAKANKPQPKARTVAVDKPEGEVDPIAFARVYTQGLVELSAESVAAIQASETAYGESTTSVITTTRSQLDAMLAAQAAANAAKEKQESESMDRISVEKAKRADEDAAIVSARTTAAYQFEVDEAAKKVALAETTAAAEAAVYAKLKGDLYSLTVNNSAKMLAVDLQDKEKSKTAAQRATAAVVQGLGDMAMVKSGLAAAAGNWAEAAAYSVAGTLAYGIAAKLAPSEKTKTTAPAAATSGGGGTTNTSYNLRVDAAFADGESVARRFAEMQQGAQRRGLI